ncbi:MAG: glycosyl hydrolase, partial [Congregibacter sp.]|nr:glycosyl hydrolase [Congregibacter sp.]
PDADDKAPGKDTSGMPDTRVLTAHAGLNRYIWDLNYPGMQRFDGMILWSDMKTGPRATPGAYRAQLSVNGERQDVTFEVVADPRSSATPQDFAAQFDFVLETRDLLSRMHTEIGKLRGFRGQLDALQARLIKAGDDLEKPSPLLSDIVALGKSITGAEEALYQTKNQSNQDPLNFPIRLNDKLASLMRMVATGDAAPPSQAVAVKAEMSASIEAQLAILQGIWETEVPALNAKIKSQGMDMIALGAD